MIDVGLKQGCWWRHCKNDSGNTLKAESHLQTDLIILYEVWEQNGVKDSLKGFVLGN
jgi:hypothetical protein